MACLCVSIASQHVIRARLWPLAPLRITNALFVAAGNALPRVARSPVLRGSGRNGFLVLANAADE